MQHAVRIIRRSIHGYHELQPHPSRDARSRLTKIFGQSIQLSVRGQICIVDLGEILQRYCWFLGHGSTPFWQVMSFWKKLCDGRDARACYVSATLADGRNRVTSG